MTWSEISSNYLTTKKFLNLTMTIYKVIPQACTPSFFFNNVVIQNLILGIIKYTYLKIPYFQILQIFLFYTWEMSLGDNKVLSSKWKLPLFYYTFFSGQYFWKFWHIRIKICKSSFWVLTLCMMNKRFLR